MRPRSLAAVFIIASGIFAAGMVYERAIADSSPKISEVNVEGTEATSTTITWKTDRKTDSFVSFSEDTNYCGVRNSGDASLDHSVVVPGLLPGTTYFFQVRSTDQDGNQSFSGDYIFTTTSTIAGKDLSSITNTAQRNLAAKAVAAIEGLTNAKALNAVAETLNAQAEENVGPPKILGDPKLDIGADQAVVSWSTDQSADGAVYVASDAEYSAGGSYSRKEEDLNGESTNHEVTIYGLTPSTLYHYKVASQGTIGSAGESNDLTFTTKSLLPQILNPHLIKVQEHSATISWATPYPSAGVVQYTNMNNKKALSVGDPSFLVTHTVQLNDLAFQTRYSVVIKAENQGGDSVTSQPLYFVTTKDVVPPVISQVSNDSTLYPGEDTKVQTIVSWITDEPAACALMYVKGVVKSENETVSTPMETGFLTNHVSVVTDFTPDEVYKYWVNCHDLNGNETNSEDFVLLTPQQEKSIIDIIVGNFKSTFGWLNGIGGKAK